jgi:hypothetical protein
MMSEIIKISEIYPGKVIWMNARRKFRKSNAEQDGTPLRGPVFPGISRENKPRQTNRHFWPILRVKWGRGGRFFVFRTRGTNEKSACYTRKMHPAGRNEMRIECLFWRLEYGINTLIFYDIQPEKPSIEN